MRLGSREAACPPGATRTPHWQLLWCCLRRSSPHQRTGASCLSNEPNNRVCHLLAGIKWKVLVVAGETATKSVKNSLKTHRLVFIRAGEGKNKQNMSFCVSLRRALHAAAPASSIPGTGLAGPQGAPQPMPAIPSAGGQSCARPRLRFFLVSGHFLSTPRSWPGSDPSASHGDTCCWNKLLFLWVTLVVFYTYCWKMNSHFYAKRFYCDIRKR